MAGGGQFRPVRSRRGERRAIAVDVEDSGSGARAFESLKRARKIVARWIISKALSTRSSTTGEGQ